MNLSRRLQACNAFSTALSNAWRAVARMPSRLRAGALDLLAPGHCRECGGAVASHDEPFCEACLGRIEWIDSACARCGAPVPNPAPAPDGTDELPFPCGHCSTLRLAFDLASAAAPYEGLLRTAVVRYKFHGDGGVEPLLVQALARAARAPLIAGAVVCADALVPVPTHRLKRWWRGRDHVLDLLRRAHPSLVDGGRVPVRPILEKVRWTPPQVGLHREARRRNLRAAFRIRRGEPAPRRAVLVDDVLTTGTTASECARALKAAGTEQVVVLTAARS